MSRVLVVEDEAHLAQGLRFNLEAEGYSAEVVGDGEAATERLLDKKENFDAVVLDIMLPGKGWFQRGFRIARGAELCAGADADGARSARRCAEGFCRGRRRLFAQAVRSVDSAGASARTAAPQPVDAGWRSGRERDAVVADATSPASEPRSVSDFGTFSFNGKTIDFGTLELRTADNVIHLTLMESELLRHLVRNDGRVVSRKQILEEVWGLHEDTDTRAIDNFMVRLRRYIEDDPAQPRHLLTVRGVGYRFLANPEKK